MDSKVGTKETEGVKVELLVRAKEGGFLYLLPKNVSLVKGTTERMTKTTTTEAREIVKPILVDKISRDVRDNLLYQSLFLAETLYGFFLFTMNGGSLALF